MPRFRKISLAALLVCLVALPLTLIHILRSPQRKPQYVFLICLDAVRPDHLSCYGYQVRTSPRIDDLAGRSALFEDAVSQAPWTTPSIATVLSSTFPCQHRARRNEGRGSPYTGPSVNFIKILSSLDFKTAFFTGGLALRGKVSATELTKSALAWLKENTEHDCLIVMHHYETHTPYVASPECIDRLDPGYAGRYKYRFRDFELLKKARVGKLVEAIELTEAEIRHIKALYDCQILRADRSIGVLVDSLDTWDCLEESMIIIFADHGEEFLEHGSIDHGQTVYEESIKVPLVIFCPSLITEPRRIKEQVGLIDIAPTIFDALRVEKLPSFEGVSLMPLVSSRFGVSRQAKRPCGIPATCLISEFIARRSEKKALRCPPWKLIFDPFFGTHALYDISKDPGETENLLEIYPEIAAQLADTLLIMQKYYPGGWFIAWRGDTDGSVRGTVRLGSPLIEAAGHNIFPEVDPLVDSLQTSEDRKSVFFRSDLGSQWEGVEIRMTSARDAEIDMQIDRASHVDALVGRRRQMLRLPAVVSPSQARVERKDLHKVFASDDVECIIVWVEPGSEPAAGDQKEEELRRQLKSIGYIE